MEIESNVPAVVTSPNEVTVFTTSGFENAQRMAKALATSNMVPKDYQGNLANCLVALELSLRTGSSVMAVMQNLHVIHGRPSWSSSYIIAAVNNCGRFAPLKFLIKGEGDAKTCIAWTTDKTGERLEGPPVSIAMAKAEGWYSKNGSKWQTMPDLMLRYRAAAFFGRLYAPEILMGMQSEDEMREVKDVTPNSKTDKVSEINRKVRQKVQQGATSEPTSPNVTSDAQPDKEPTGADVEKQYQGDII